MVFTEENTKTLPDKYWDLVIDVLDANKRSDSIDAINVFRGFEIGLISEFIDDLKNKQYFWKVYRNQIIEKWETRLKA